MVVSLNLLEVAKELMTALSDNAFSLFSYCPVSGSDITAWMCHLNQMTVVCILQYQHSLQHANIVRIVVVCAGFLFLVLFSS